MKVFGIIGFGEAGSAFAKVLAEKGMRVVAYDKSWDQPGAGPPRNKGHIDDRIEFSCFPDLLALSDIVLSTVTTDAALNAATACIEHLRPQHYYCDLNSTAPSVKTELDRVIAPTGAVFVEGAILGAIGVTGGRTKILLGGSDAHNLSEILNRAGLHTSPYSSEIGKASTFKMLRSIFSKGLEALLIEFLTAGRAAGIQDDLWQEITTLFTDNSFEDVARNWVCSHGIAHERRFHEMIQVADLLREMNQDMLMTEATLALFEQSTERKLAQDFSDKPEQMNDVIDALLRRKPAQS